MTAVVVGVGNLLRGDDGVGLLVAREVERLLGVRPGVKVVEVSAGGLAIAEALVDFDQAIVVDALAGAPSGEVREVVFGGGEGTRGWAGPHDADLSTALAALRAAGCQVPWPRVVGIGAAEFDVVRLTPSAAVQSAIPRAASLVLEWLALDDEVRP